MQNNPLMYTDPSGHIAIFPTGTGVGRQKLINHCVQVGLSTCWKEYRNDMLTASMAVADFMYIDDINTILDPNSSGFDRSLAAAGFIPVAKLFKAGKLIVKLVSKEGRKIERAVYFIGEGTEKTLDSTLKSYEQARNLSFDIIGDMGDTVPYYGRLSSSAGYGKIIGRESVDGKVRWRVDYDPEKGMHINIEDFRKGKGTDAVKLVIPFDGTEDTFKSIIKGLN